MFGAHEVFAGRPGKSYPKLNGEVIRKVWGKLFELLLFHPSQFLLLLRPKLVLGLPRGHKCLLDVDFVVVVSA